MTASAEGKAMPERQVLELERALQSPERSDLATVTQAARKGPGWPGFASSSKHLKASTCQGFCLFRGLQGEHKATF